MIYAVNHANDMTSALGGETNSMEEKRDISDFLSCSENQALLDHLLKEEKKAPYAKGVGPYHAASIRKVGILSTT